MTTLTLRVPADLADWLNRRARALNRPKSEIIRPAMESERNGKNFESATARVGDLAGKYAGSKHSSHKRNLNGLGSCNSI